MAISLDNHTIELNILTELSVEPDKLVNVIHDALRSLADKDDADIINIQVDHLSTRAIVVNID